MLLTPGTLQLFVEFTAVSVGEGSTGLSQGRRRAQGLRRQLSMIGQRVPRHISAYLPQGNQRRMCSSGSLQSVFTMGCCIFASNRRKSIGAIREGKKKLRSFEKKKIVLTALVYLC